MGRSTLTSMWSRCFSPSCASDKVFSFLIVSILLDCSGTGGSVLDWFVERSSVHTCWGPLATTTHYHVQGVSAGGFLCT